MSNRPNYKHTVNLAEYKQRRTDEASIAIELEGDQPPVVIPPPEFWPDDLPRGGGHRLAVAILGQEEFDRFVAAGGSARIVNAIFEEMSEKIQGEDPGKSSSSGDS